MVKQSYKPSKHRNGMVRHNMKFHEHLGLLFIFIGVSWIGLGFYISTLNAIAFSGGGAISGNALLYIPLFYGLGSVITYLGIIELREVLPGKNR